MSKRDGHAKVPLGEAPGGFEELDISELTEVAHLLPQLLETVETIVSHPVQSARPEPAKQRYHLGVGERPPGAGGVLQLERVIHFLGDTVEVICVDQVGDPIHPHQSAEARNTQPRSQAERFVRGSQGALRLTEYPVQESQTGQQTTSRRRIALPNHRERARHKLLGLLGTSTPDEENA